MTEQELNKVYEAYCTTCNSFTHDCYEYCQGMQGRSCQAFESFKASLEHLCAGIKDSLSPEFDADYLQSKIDLHTKYMQEHGITSEQQLATLEEMRGQEKYIPSADYLNAAKKAFQKACGWLAVFPWYQGVYEEFVNELEENL